MKIVQLLSMLFASQISGNPAPNVTNATGILPVANGGTGSATQNFVDLTTDQASIGGVKTFTSASNHQGTVTSGITATSNTTLTTSGTIQGPSLIAGGTADQAGGNLTITTGSGKGAGTQPTLIMQAPVIGSSGTTLTTPVTVLTIAGSGATFAKDGIFSSASVSSVKITGGGFLNFSTAGSKIYINGAGSTTNFKISDGTVDYLTADTLNGISVLPTTTSVATAKRFSDSAAAGITAAGTSQSDCTVLTSDVVDVSTVGANSGVCLPVALPGSRFYVHTSGANSLKIYMNAAAGVINALSASTAVSIANVAGATPGARTITCTSATQCWSNATLPDTN